MGRVGAAGLSPEGEARPVWGGPAAAARTVLQRFAIDALTPMPWNNGGGSTREIACWPEGAGLDDFARLVPEAAGAVMLAVRMGPDD